MYIQLSLPDKHLMDLERFSSMAIEQGIISKPANELQLLVVDQFDFTYTFR